MHFFVEMNVSINIFPQDTLHSAMSVVSRLCAKMEPHDPNLDACVDSLGGWC